MPRSHHGCSGFLFYGDFTLVLPARLDHAHLGNSRCRSLSLDLFRLVCSRAMVTIPRDKLGGISSPGGDTRRPHEVYFPLISMSRIVALVVTVWLRPEVSSLSYFLGSKFLGGASGLPSGL